MQRTAINTECKLLLLTHAFEQARLHRRRVPHQFLQLPVAAAIARLGAKQDGILRNHQLQGDGTLRDTVVFSIIEQRVAGGEAAPVYEA